jgi:RHS repeat-associated protein
VAVLRDTNAAFQPFGFAGGIDDADTHLVRFGARDYDVATGRWTATDPILFSGSPENLYSYEGNDPVSTIDVEGLCFAAADGSARMCSGGGGGGPVRPGMAGGTVPQTPPPTKPRSPWLIPADRMPNIPPSPRGAGPRRSSSEIRCLAVGFADRHVSPRPRHKASARTGSMYLAAEQWLRKIAAGKYVRWWIVGHGLYDKMLLKLLVDVSREGPACHRFMIVGPELEETWKRLESHLRAPAQGTMETRSTTAETCMGSLCVTAP